MNEKYICIIEIELLMPIWSDSQSLEMYRVIYFLKSVERQKLFIWIMIRNVYNLYTFIEIELLMSI